ncbi:MAG: RluA family pseudouridine synthase [Sedimentisphaerales bacterium]|nr:RluA family pseudouridine synthase [Sedimentisphaerales bacterium]
MLEVLYEDNDIVAVNKPEGLVAVPERRRQSPSLFERLCAERGERLYIVHRIDRETSGVVVFARNAEAHRRLNCQFETRSVEKVYLALVHGIIGDDRGEIDRPLRQFGSGRVGVDDQRGKSSVTELRVLERLKAFTLLDVRPHTGRRHQIRVHLYSIGHPVVGDPLYGEQIVQCSFPRLMLHAYELSLHLPSGKRLTVEAPVPESFSRIVQTARRQ